jgi:hypothetical protein
LAERDDIGIGRLIEPLSALDEFGAKVDKMRDRPTEARRPELEEGPKYFRNSVAAFQSSRPYLR